jgi:hypothetical protein
MSEEIVRKKVSDPDAERLLELLNRVIVLLKNSEDTAYAFETVDAGLRICGNELDKLAENGEIALDEISFLFIPTGDFQEISLANNWADEYLALASSFDRLNGRYKS